MFWQERIVVAYGHFECYMNLWTINSTCTGDREYDGCLIVLNEKWAIDLANEIRCMKFWSYQERNNVLQLIILIYNYSPSSTNVIRWHYHLYSKTNWKTTFATSRIIKLHEYFIFCKTSKLILIEFLNLNVF